MNDNTNISQTKEEKIYKLLDIFENLPEPLQNKMLEEIILTVQECVNKSQ